MRSILILILIACLLATPTQAQPNLLSNGDFSQGLNGWRVVDRDEADNRIGGAAQIGITGTRGKLDIVDAKVGRFHKAVRATSAPHTGDQPYTFVLQFSVSTALHKGEELTLRMWLRSPESVQTSVMVEESTPPYNRAFSRELALSPQWKEYMVRGLSPKDYLDGETQVTFWLAHAPGTIEIAGVHLSNVPPLKIDLQIGHVSAVQNAVFSTDERLIATASVDGTVKVWDAATGTLQRTLQAGSNDSLGAGDVAFSPDGRWLAGASDKVYLWDLALGTLKVLMSVNSPGVQGKFGIPYKVAFSADGKSLYSANWPGIINQWNVATGSFVRTVVPAQAENCVAFNWKRQLVAAGDEKAALARIWSLQGQLHKTLDLPAKAHALNFSADGNLIAVSTDDTKVSVFHTPTGKLIRTFEKPSDTHVNALAFSPDNSLLATGDFNRRIYLWELSTGAKLKTFWHGAAINSLTFSQDGKTLLSGSTDKIAALWDVSSSSRRVTFGQPATTFAVSVSPDGETLAAGTETGFLQLWNLRTGKLIKIEDIGETTRSVQFSPVGNYLACGAGHTVKVWNWRNGQLLHTLNGSAYWQSSLCFSSDGNSLATEGSDGASVKLWDCRTGELKKTFTLSANDVNGGFIANARDGSILRYIWAPGTVSLRDMATGAEVGAWKEEGAAVRLSPDGKTLALAGNRSLKLIDLATKEVRSRIDTDWPKVESLSFSPDSTIIVAGLEDHSIRLWDAASGKSSDTWQAAHLGKVHSLCFLPNGKTLASSGEDGIKLWNMTERRLLASLLTMPPSSSLVNNDKIENGVTPVSAIAQDRVAANSEFLVLTPAGYYDSSSQADRFMRFKAGEQSYPAECFQSLYYRPDLVQRALSGEELALPESLKGPYPPLAGIVTPHNSTKVNGNTATVMLNASDDNDVKNVAFFVNGARVEAQLTAMEARPLTADAKALMADAKALIADARPLTTDARNIPVAHKISRRFTATIPIPTDATTIKVQAIAFDDDGLQSPREEILFTRDTAATQTAGKLLGVCVGVSRYQDSKLNLRFADADATSLAQALNKQRGIYSAANVNALTNEQATSTGVKAALDNIVAQTSRNDTVIISLSGHGWRSDERTFYFATHEVNRNNVASTALPWREVTERLAQLSQKSKRVIVLLDACHSGSAASNEELVKAILSANAGVMVFASSKGSEVSLENAEWEHGAFTKALLEGISGQATITGENSVTLWDFATYVRRRVKQLTEGTQNPQVPFLQDFDTDAAILAKP